MSASELPDLVEPDVMTTGEVNLMDTPVEERISAWKRISRFVSIAAHAALILFIFVEPKIFPYRPPTADQLNLAQNELTWANLPALSSESPRSSPRPQPQSQQMRVDPRALRQAAPPEPDAAPQPERTAPSQEDSTLPSAPTPQPQQVAPAPQPQAMPAAPDAPAPQPTNNGLILPKVTSGASPDDLREGDDGGATRGFAAPMPGARSRGGGGYEPGGGGDGPGAGGTIQMLTPTEGVDFSGYLARVLDSVKRNWYAIMPESAEMGDRGRVVLDFKILRDGNVPGEDPAMMSSSQKEPLDRAASSAIRASSPFEPLPSEFSGPYIELRFYFFYNIPQSEEQVPQ
jgi:TonB family protein